METTDARKSPVRLTPNEEYAIYKYAVENHCLAQEGDLFNFRVEPARIAKEVNISLNKMLEGREIRAGHIKTAVASVIGWQARLNKLPVVPIETTELEQLKINKTKMIREIEELKLAVEHKDKTIAQAAKEIERLKKPSDAQVRLDRIRAIVSA